jgi:hypothetical protein
MATLETGILGVLRVRPGITSSDLAKALGANLDSVEAGCRRLKRQRLLAEGRQSSGRSWMPTAQWRRRESILGLLQEGPVETPDLAQALRAPLRKVRDDCHRLADLGLVTETLQPRLKAFQVFPVTLEVVGAGNGAAVKRLRKHLAALLARYPLSDPRLVEALDRYLDGPANFPRTPGMRFRIGLFKSRLHRALKAAKSSGAIKAMFVPWTRISPAFRPQVAWWRLTTAAAALIPSTEDPHRLLEAA